MPRIKERQTHLMELLSSPFRLNREASQHEKQPESIENKNSEEEENPNFCTNKCSSDDSE